MKITIDRELTERFKMYADVTKTPVEDAIRNALAEWMEICGEADLEVLTGCPFPMPGDSPERSEDRPALRLLN